MRPEQVTRQEWPELTEIWEEAVRATHGFLPESDFTAIRAALLPDCFPAVRLYAVRLEDGTLGGFAGISGRKLEMLFARPRCFGLGIGKALLGFAVSACGITEVDVNEQNPRALAFYLRNGFEVAGRSELDSAGRPYPILHLKRKGKRNGSER